MPRFQLTLTVQPHSEIALDALAAQLADLGAEAFDRNTNGSLTTVLLADNQASLSAQLRNLDPLLPGVSLQCHLAPAPEADWNAAWEATGFTPISVGRLDIVPAHAGQTTSTQDTTGSVPPGDNRGDRLTLLLQPQLAFGSGHHFTTRLMLSELLTYDLTNKRVLDVGCGTGILGLAALLLGAEEATALDIDPGCVDNTRHNALLNGLRLRVLLGDLAETKLAERFHVILANIHRNVIIDDMPRYAALLAPGGHLLLSGFLNDDIPAIDHAAVANQLSPMAHRCDNEWQLLCFQPSVP